MKLLDLFVAASIPVIKVLLLTALGSFLALDHINILGEDTRKHMNSIVFYVFNPALVGSNLAQTITYGSLVELWFMPVNILITFIIGSALGWAVNQITRAPTHLRGLVIGCCAAGNLGNILIIIIPAVCKDKGSPFGAPDVCHRYGMAYASLSMAVPFLDHVKQKIGMLLGKTNLKRLFAPSTIGAIVGFIVGLVPQIRTALIGDTAPLQVIQDSVSLLGDGAIPAVTLILGGNLLRGLKGSEIQKSIILGVIVARYIALPLMGIVIVKGALRFGFVHENPLYQFVLLLQFAVPPAMNIGTITQLFGAGESECSVIMLWTYALASISLTLWSTFFMWLVT
ncbi:protein PIN-LIKES 4-like isoform X2 [Rhododendron vialii]|uniref:protein PIN-LIKES 4-like isoform X2 n=1 Tax=Rhododendron vialii TaxID=182163 RepID=UPI00265E6EEA|nr:protein PIN-LIKES 4-like isoform X2 [Rhododendron vialii]